MGGSRGHSGRGSYSGHGHSGHGYSGSRSYHGGSSRYHGSRGYSYGGRSYIGISPYGLRYGYYGSGFGISIGSYNRPGYPYYRYGSGYYGYPSSSYYYGYPSSGYYGSYGYASPSYSSGYSGAPVYVESAPPVVIEGNAGSRIVEVQPDGSTLPLGQNVAGGEAYASARPIAAQRGPVIASNEKAAPFELQAEEAFRERRYADARRHVEHAQVEDPENGQLSLFESQILFALGNFEESAAALRKGTLQVGPDEWGYVVDNYDRLYTGNDYVDQMNRLIGYTDEHPDAAYACTLQGYHYLYLGHKDAAAKKLRRAVTLEGSDGLAAELLAAAGGEAPREELPPPPPLPGPVSDDAAVEPAAEEADKEADKEAEKAGAGK